MMNDMLRNHNNNQPSHDMKSYSPTSAILLTVKKQAV